MSECTERRYEAQMPDTFDLVERANWIINAATGSVDMESDCAPAHYVGLLNPGIGHHSGEMSDLPEYLEDLTRMRSITGSELNLDIESRMLETALDIRGNDGLFYQLPVTPTTPWRAGGATRTKMKNVEDMAQVCLTFIAALSARYQATGDGRLSEMAQQYADTIAKILVQQDDYAYVPLTDDTGIEFSWRRNVGWSTQEEPRSEFSGTEGTVLAYYGYLIRQLAHWHTVSGDEKSLETAGKLATFLRKPRFWLGRIESWEEDKWVGHPCPYRMPAAHFRGHIAGGHMGLRGMTEYAVAADDQVLLEFCRQGYEWLRNFGFASLGWYGENLCLRDAVATAIKLTEAGVGDYWDDVERYAVNEMAESQTIDPEVFKKVRAESGKPMTEDEEKLLLRLMGANGSGTWATWFYGPQPDPANIDPGYTGVYMQHYYYVHDAALREGNGVVRVNLPLNRVSASADLHSYLPYEGKLVLKNKTAKKALIRVPGWVTKRDVKCSVNGSPQQPFWAGQYVLIDDLKPGDSVNIEFPMKEWTEHVTWRGFHDPVPVFEEMNWVPRYHLQFKGNTCVGIDFNWKEIGATRVPGIPGYQREHMKANKAPMKRAQCYVPEKRIVW